MPALRIQDFLVPTSPSRRRCRRFPFYFPFKKRQVEMTTLASRVFRRVPGLDASACFSRGYVSRFLFTESPKVQALSASKPSTAGWTIVDSRTKCFLGGASPGFVD